MAVRQTILENTTDALTVIKREKKGPNRIDVYEEFVLWYAMPPSERYKLGIETQEEFTQYYHIGINTPTVWKSRSDFQKRVRAMRNELAFERTSDVLEGMYRGAVSGNAGCQKLWLQYFCDFGVKQKATTPPVRFASVDDTLSLIEALPEDKREKHYDAIRTLMLDASIAHVKAQAEDNMESWNGRPPEGWRPRYVVVDTYQEAQ